MKPGSRINWSGDPMDGQIESWPPCIKPKPVPPIYLPLNWRELAKMNGWPTENCWITRSIWKLKAHCWSPLLKPKLNFFLDMLPRDQPAFGGLVYSKIQQLNTDPNELNKQVFSLLVLNKFIPPGSSGGANAGNAVSTVARKQCEPDFIRSTQCLSGKYVKGAEAQFQPTNHGRLWRRCHPTKYSPSDRPEKKAFQQPVVASGWQQCGRIRKQAFNQWVQWSKPCRRRVDWI